MEQRQSLPFTHQTSSILFVFVILTLIIIVSALGAIKFWIASDVFFTLPIQSEIVNTAFKEVR